MLSSLIHIKFKTTCHCSFVKLFNSLIYSLFHITESQSHRMALVRRDLKNHQSPNPLPQAGLPTSTSDTRPYEYYKNKEQFAYTSPTLRPLLQKSEEGLVCVRNGKTPNRNFAFTRVICPNRDLSLTAMHDFCPTFQLEELKYCWSLDFPTLSISCHVHITFLYLFFLQTLLVGYQGPSHQNL